MSRLGQLLPPFCQRLCHHCKPLHHLTTRGTFFAWTEACQDSFHTLKQRLVSAAVLVFPDFAAQFILDTNGLVLCCLRYRMEQRDSSLCKHGPDKARTQLLFDQKVAASCRSFPEAFLTVSFGDEVHTPNRPWLPELALQLQGTRRTISTLAGEATGV